MGGIHVEVNFRGEPCIILLAEEGGDEAQEALITLHGSGADILVVARPMEGERHPSIETEGLGRCFGGLRFELHDDQEANHAVNFLGGAAEGFAEFLGELRSRQALEDRAEENSLPAFAEDARRGWMHFSTQVIDCKSYAMRSNAQ